VKLRSYRYINHFVRLLTYLLNAVINSLAVTTIDRKGRKPTRQRYAVVKYDRTIKPNSAITIHIKVI